MNCPATRGQVEHRAGHDAEDEGGGRRDPDRGGRVSTDGWATYALSESGSWKYITTMTRT